LISTSVFSNVYVLSINKVALNIKMTHPRVSNTMTYIQSGIKH
jgi:hypothetical protein